MTHAEDLEMVRRTLHGAQDGIWVGDVSLPDAADDALNALSRIAQHHAVLREALRPLIDAAQEAVDGDNPFLGKQLTRLAREVKRARTALSHAENGGEL